MIRVFRSFPSRHVADYRSHAFYRGWGSFDQVFHGVTKRFSTAPIPGLLSIRQCLRGSVKYRLNHALISLEPENYLVLNHGEIYEVHIASDAPTEAFCVFFSPQTVVDAYLSFKSPTLRRLLDPGEAGLAPEFFSRLYPDDNRISPWLHSLRTLVEEDSSPCTLRLEAIVQGLLFALLTRTRALLPEFERIRAARASTRIELYRRLHRARDHMQASFQRPISNHELAKVACLSQFHFQRLFRELFGRSVHESVTGLRVREAMHRLARSSEPIDQIARAVGFAHHPSFTRAFRRTLGITPGEYRKRQARPPRS